MTTPSVSIQKADGNTGVVRPSPSGVLAILATSSMGTLNLAATYTKREDVKADYGLGELPEFAAYDMAVAKKPVVAIRLGETTVGAYSAFVASAGAGTSVITAGITEPEDAYNVLVTFVAGGTRGTAGITYKYSLDGGESSSAVLALGTATSIVIPNSGVTLALAAGTIVAGQTTTFTTTPPRAGTADLTAGLEALRIAGVPWEILLVGGIADATMATALDLWLSGLEATGKFRHAIANVRMRNVGEDDAAYRTAMQAIADAVSSIRVTLAADGAEVVSVLTGLRQARPASLFVAARCMQIDIGTDPARKSDGAATGALIKDDRGNPRYHDELLYPGLDDLRFATLRSFDGDSGAFITNAPIMSSNGSDYVYIQHARVMNRACEVAFQTLSSRLSSGVRKNRKADPITGAVYILEHEAQNIEGLVNAALATALAKRVSGIRFVLSRTDDIGSNAGAELTGEVQNSALAYVKKFTVKAAFVRALG